MATMDAKGFDVYRQQIWEQGVYLVDNKNAAKNNGTLTASMLSTFIVSLTTLMASFNATYQSVRSTSPSPFSPGIAQAWIDPRFHDYYDFFTKIIGDWEAELQGMLAAQSTTVAATPAPINTGSTSQFSSSNTASQASAAGDVQPQAPYVAPQTSFAPTTTSYETYEQAGIAQGDQPQQASMSPWIIGGIVLGLIFMGKKRKVSA